MSVPCVCAAHEKVLRYSMKYIVMVLFHPYVICMKNLVHVCLTFIYGSRAQEPEALEFNEILFPYLKRLLPHLCERLRKTIIVIRWYNNIGVHIK